MGRKKKSKEVPSDSDSGSQAVDTEEITDVLGTAEGQTPTEDSEASDEIEDIVEEESSEPEDKREKTHEKVARLAAERNTRGYGR